MPYTDSGKSPVQLLFARKMKSIFDKSLPGKVHIKEKTKLPLKEIPEILQNISNL